MAIGDVLIEENLKECRRLLERSQRVEHSAAELKLLRGAVFCLLMIVEHQRNIEKILNEG